MAAPTRFDERDARKEAHQIAIFPIGAIEQHSLHLPLGTDWLDVIDLARRIAAELDACEVPRSLRGLQRGVPFRLAEHLI
jgi:creatinine amidohydrolase/Fe(II)-dependent formamide hydrolase-like protein